MAQITGIVQEIAFKQTSAGQMADIVVAGEKYGAGLAKYLKAKEGDYVTFELDDSRGYKNVARNSLKVSKNKAPPEAVAEANATKANVAKAVNGFDARQDAISRQAASNTAIAYMVLLHAAGALPVSTSKTKGAAQASLDAIREEYEKVFYERNTGQAFKDISPSAPKEDVSEDSAEADVPDDDAWE